MIAAQAVQSAQAQTAASPTGQAAVARKIALLLPSDDPQLRRAAAAVREGVHTVLRGQAGRIELKECAYRGPDQVATVYAQCVDDTIDWVIGPLGRADVSALVTALASASGKSRKPTLLLAALPFLPPHRFFTLAPDLESEAEAIARRVVEDACRAPLLLEASGASAARVSVAVTSWWREHSALELRALALPPRVTWARSSESWREQAHDCLIFAGPGSTLAELRPYLRGMRIYLTSATYEHELDRLLDWTGVRIADAAMLIEPEEWSLLAPAGLAASSPTLVRLHALGVDAAMLALAAQADTPPGEFNGALGRLKLKHGQYQRLPPIGEFRERRLVRAGR
jgi:Putative lipoprotein